MVKKTARKATAMKRAKPPKAAKKPVRKPKAAARPAKVKTPKKASPAAAKKAPSLPPKPAAESLGRPLVTAEEKLYLLFREDYHARQIFEFLRVDTVGELEQYSPHQIIQILSLPLRKTVERIRQRLAENKRHLRDDATFAQEYRVAKASG